MPSPRGSSPPMPTTSSAPASCHGQRRASRSAMPPSTSCSTRWSQRCTSDGIADFYGLQYIACREMIEGGDVFARRRWRSEPIAGVQSKDKIVPLQIQLLEAEFLDRAKNGPVGPNYASAGIEFDGIGGRRGYWLFQQHPGAAVPNPKLSREFALHPGDRGRAPLRAAAPTGDRGTVAGSGDRAAQGLGRVQPG